MSIITVISGTVNGRSETPVPKVPSARPGSRPLLWDTSGRLGASVPLLLALHSCYFLEEQNKLFHQKADVSKMEAEATPIVQMAPELWVAPAHSGGSSKIRLRPESPGTQDLPGAFLVLIFHGLWGF